MGALQENGHLKGPAACGLGPTTINMGQVTTFMLWASYRLLDRILLLKSQETKERDDFVKEFTGDAHVRLLALLAL